MKRKPLLNLTLAAMFLAIGIMLPQVTMRIQSIGSMLLPMHLPVLICGFICGYKYGMAVGALTPIICSFVFSMPPLYPTAIAMMIELAVYGLLTGLLSKKLNVYVALIISMLGGRVINGLAMLILLGIKGNPYTFSAFIGGAFIDALPGIIIQLVLVPIVVMLLRKIETVKELNV